MFKAVLKAAVEPEKVDVSPEKHVIEAISDNDNFPSSRDKCAPNSY